MADKGGNIFSGGGGGVRVSQNTFSNAAGAVSDILGGIATAKGLRIKARGNQAEAENYDLAANLAEQQRQFAKTSTDLRVYQASRAAYQGVGATQADIAGAGFAMTGSAVDLMRDSAMQGALTREVAHEQGQIQEMGYEEQVKSFQTMAAAARQAASDEQDLAGDSERNGYITGGLKGAAAIASLFV